MALGKNDSTTGDWQKKVRNEKVRIAPLGFPKGTPAGTLRTLNLVATGCRLTGRPAAGRLAAGPAGGGRSSGWSSGRSSGWSSGRSSGRRSPLGQTRILGQKFHAILPQRVHKKNWQLGLSGAHTGAVSYSSDQPAMLGEIRASKKCGFA